MSHRERPLLTATLRVYSGELQSLSKKIQNRRFRDAEAAELKDAMDRVELEIDKIRSMAEGNYRL